MKEKDEHDPPGVTLSEAASTVTKALTPRLPPQVGTSRRDNLDQPLLNSAGPSSQLHATPSMTSSVIPVSIHVPPPSARTAEFSRLDDISVNGAPGRALDDPTTLASNFVRSRATSSMNSNISGIRSSIRGNSLSFHQISYVVQTKRFAWSKPVPKEVLKGVSGIMRPGMNAIMGPTGSGKSSILDALAGRKDPRYLSGEVLVDGCAQPENFKCLSGYVVQDDIVMGTLTVRENLRFSAALRLPRTTTEAERKAKVEEVIEELGLSHVAESKIGTELIRGVSGGERKRTNIGMELITDPPVLFLDEPTTGLDAFTAGSVLKLLKNLANRGRTIIFSIHQPKYSIYKLFDSLTLVCKGELVYHGRADKHPLTYFKKFDYICEDQNNPADFFMDVLLGEAKLGVQELDALDEDALPKDSQAEVGKKLITCWKRSSNYRKIEEEVTEIYNKAWETGSSSSQVKVKKGQTINYPTNFWNQLNFVCWRTCLNLFRNPQSSVVQLAVYLFFALAIGVVYRPLSTSTEAGIQDRMGFFFFCMVQMVFVNLSAIEVFIKERVIFIHETSSGYYRVSVYFIAKIFCDMFPIKAMPVALFMPMCYFLTGLRIDAGAFFFFELNLILATVAACGIAFFVSASFSVFGVANIFVAVIYVFMMVFGGYMINVKSMADWLSWCRYLSIFRFGLAGLAVNEFKDILFCSQYNITNVTDHCELGSVYLDDQGISYGTGWDLWQNEFGMMILIVVFFTLCYVQLLRINTYK